jgi:hypothetical protein
MYEAATPVVLNWPASAPAARRILADLTISCCDHVKGGLVAGRGYKIA